MSDSETSEKKPLDFSVNVSSTYIFLITDPGPDKRSDFATELSEGYHTIVRFDFQYIFFRLLQPTSREDYLYFYFMLE